MNKYTRMRMQAGLTMRELANAGKSQGYYVTPAIVSDVENGHVKPSLDVLRTYYTACEGLDCVTFKLENTDVRTGASVVRYILESWHLGQEELQAMLGVSDRKVRDYLLELKKILKDEGLCLLNLQDGNGFRISKRGSPQDVDDARRYRAQELSRIQNAMISIEAAEAYLRGVEQREQSVSSW